MTKNQEGINRSGKMPFWVHLLRWLPLILLVPLLFIMIATSRSWILIRVIPGNSWGVNVLSPDGSKLVTTANYFPLLPEERGYDDSLVARVWDFKTGQLIGELRGHEGQITSCTFSPSGEMIATSSEDKTSRVWDAHTMKLLFILTEHRSQVDRVAFSEDETRILTLDQEGRIARVWNARTGTIISELIPEGDQIETAIFSSDGRRVLATLKQSTISLVWNAETGSRVAVLKGHTSRITSACFAPDRKRILTSSMDGTARVWNAITGNVLCQFRRHQESVISGSFSPDSVLAVSVSDDATARIWNSSSGRQLKKFSLAYDAVISASFSPNGAYLLTLIGSTQDGLARIWNVETGNMTATLKTGQHCYPVTFASFHPDGIHIIVSTDVTTQIWAKRSTLGLLGYLYRPEGWVFILLIVLTLPRIYQSLRRRVRDADQKKP